VLVVDTVPEVELPGAVGLAEQATNAVARAAARSMREARWILMGIEVPLTSTELIRLVLTPVQVANTAPSS
jgi:hypothetical protein